MCDEPLDIDDSYTHPMPPNFVHYYGHVETGCPHCGCLEPPRNNGSQCPGCGYSSRMENDRL